MWRFLGENHGWIVGWSGATLPVRLRDALGASMSERRAHAIERAGSALRASAIPARWRYVAVARDAIRASASR